MSATKQFLDKNGLNALWSKMCSTFIPNRPSTKFYPFIGTASRSKNYKITLPYNGVTASYKLYMMNTMEIVLGSSYQKGATGKIFLSYYFTRDINGTWLANDLRAFAIGCNISPTITYQISNPAIFWISLNSTIYNVISIKNLTAEDSAPSYDYRNTTIEAVTSTPTTGISSVPITILSSDDNKLKYNGNEIAVVNHTHSYLPLSGGTLNGPLTISNNSLNITNEKPVVFNIPRCNENGGGWAVKQLIVNGHVDSEGNYPTVYSMGSYGQNNALNYIFIGANEYNSTKNLRIYPNGNVGAPTFTGDLIGNVNGNASTATKSGSGGGIWLYPENGSEVNFGGTSTDSAVYFGYRAKDSKPIPTLFIFGSSTGTAQIKAAGFIRKDSNNSYVLLGGGGHKAISDFATASKLGSSTIGATDRPIYLSGGSPVQTTYRMAGTNAAATAAIDISSATNTGIWYVNGTSSIYSQSDGVAIVNKYNDSWISQIYQDYRTGKLAVRGKNNGVWTEWKKIALTSDIPTSLPWSSITDKSETLLGYNLQERIEDLNLGTTNRFFRTGGSPNNAPGQNGYVVGLTMALNNDSDYRVQLAYDQSISRLSYRQQLGATRWGDWKKIALTSDIPTKTSHLTNDSGFLTSETYKGTVTKISTGVGLTGGDITSSGTIKCKLNSETSLGTIGTTSKLYAVGVDANGKLCVNVPWTDTNTDTSTTYDGHYTPSGTVKTGTTSGNTLSYGGAVVTGLTYDGKGHVTGFATSKLPSAITVDTSLSLTSTNPVQNKVINSALNNKMDKVTLATVATTGSYNDLTNKPTIPTTTSQLINNSGFVDNKIKTPAITSFARWDGITKFGLRAWSNNATSRPSDYGIALDFAGDNGGYEWRNRLAFATEGKGIHYYYATNGTILNYRGQLITTIGDYTLNGNLTANAYYISSDERLKTFGNDIKVDFDELAKLRKSHFVFNDNPTKQEIGVSAQEVQKIYPEIVNETEEGTLSVDYSKLAVVALAAIDKLNQRVQELENKLAKYE